jgi:hypothetical protein
MSRSGAVAAADSEAWVSGVHFALLGTLMLADGAGDRLAVSGAGSGLCSPACCCPPWPGPGQDHSRGRRPFAESASPRLSAPARAGN